jgi:hypothetical protein
MRKYYAHDEYSDIYMKHFGVYFVLNRFSKGKYWKRVEADFDMELTKPHLTELSKEEAIFIEMI